MKSELLKRMTRVEESIVRDLADKLARKIVRQVVHAIRRLPAELSGADSRLRNVWEEICVQVQGEESILWSAYRHTVEQEIASKVEALHRSERMALWLKTDQGWEWCHDYGDQEESENAAPVDNQIIVEHLWENYFLIEAGAYENKRISRFNSRDELD